MRRSEDFLNHEEADMNIGRRKVESFDGRTDDAKSSPETNRQSELATREMATRYSLKLEGEQTRNKQQTHSLSC